MTRATTLLIALLLTACPGPQPTGSPGLPGSLGAGPAAGGGGQGTTATGGGPATGGNSGASCGTVPTNGQCVDGATLEVCVQPSGANPFVQRTRCAAGEACTVVSGSAACRLVGECRDGATRCGTSGFQTCTSGHWQDETCTGTCMQTSTGATCNTAALKTLSGKFTFEGRLPKDDYNDWDKPLSFVAAGLAVASMHSGKLADLTTTDAKGKFSVKIYDPPTEDDRIVVLALGIESGNIVLSVGNPDLSAGKHTPGELGDNATGWAWRWPTTQVVANPQLYVDMAHGSAAAWVFADAWSIWQTRKFDFGAAPKTLALWVAPDVTWSCGACQWSGQVTVSGESFENQIVLSGGADQGYWSDAVIGHEIGHFIMSSYSASIFEGGPHAASIPTMPGMALSEGWATYHQADYFESPTYFDKQGGGMFWLRIDQRKYSDPVPWTRPTPAGGLLQRLDENEVAAMLWSLRGSSTSAPTGILKALASDRLRTGPYERGYTRHRWTMAPNGELTDVKDLGTSAACLADLLDALVCTGFSTAAIDAATEPTTHYPYPSNAPKCR